MIPRGTPIAVVAPCGAHNLERFEEGLAIAREQGHRLEPLPDILNPHRYLASDDDQRARQLMEAMTDERYGAVWIARGGYGLTRIVDSLDFAAMKPRPVIGFSDVTALFNGMRAHGLGDHCIHGPVVHSLPITNAESLAQFFGLLDGKQSTLKGETWNPGSVKAPIVGGNLCLLAATAGTQAQLDARGCIVVLEEIGEPAYRVDRMLQQVKSAGVLDGVVGIAMGQLVHCRAPEDADYTTTDVVREHLATLDVPVIGDLPIGHGANNCGFVWQSEATLADGALHLPAMDAKATRLASSIG